MLAHSYRSFSDSATQELLWQQCSRLGGWISCRADHVVYTVPETWAYLLVLIDPCIERLTQEDWII